jgi:hypothetical protein
MDEDAFAAPRPWLLVQLIRAALDGDEAVPREHPSVDYWPEWHMDRRAYLNEPPGTHFDADIGWEGGGWWPP